MRLLGVEFVTCLWTSDVCILLFVVWNTRIIDLCRGGTKFVVIVLYFAREYLSTCSQTGCAFCIVVCQIQAAMAWLLVSDTCCVTAYSHIWAWHFVQCCVGIQ